VRRWKAKITAACGVLGLTLGLVMFLPRLLELNASRQVLQEQIETTLGGPVQWSRLELGIEPLRLGLVDAEFGGGDDSTQQVRLIARIIELRLSAESLLRGRWGVEEVVLVGAELVMTRTSDGLLLPIPISAWLGTSAERRSFAGGNLSVEQSRVPTTPRMLIVERGHVRIRDRTGGSVRDWDLEDLRLKVSMGERMTAEGSGSLVADGGAVDDFTLRVEWEAGGRYDFELALEEGGRVRGASSLVDEERMGLTLQFEDFDLGQGRLLLPGFEWEIVGRGTGSVTLTGPVLAPSRASVALDIEDGVFESVDYVAEGPLAIEGTIDRGPGGLVGRLDLDLTRTRLRDVHGFEKRAGLRADLTLRWAGQEAGEAVFEQRLKLKDLDAMLRRGTRLDEPSLLPPGPSRD